MSKMKGREGRQERLVHKPSPFGAVLCALMLTACHAHVKNFTVQPRHICVGESVQVEWSVDGSARIKVTPPSDRLADGPVDDEDRVRIAPNANTKVELHVTKLFGHPDGAVQEIEVAGESRREALTASLGDASATPSCSEGKVRATVHANRFSPKVKVATVVSQFRSATYLPLDAWMPMLLPRAKPRFSLFRTTFTRGKPDSRRRTESSVEALSTTMISPSSVCASTLSRHIRVMAR